MYMCFKKVGERGGENGFTKFYKNKEVCNKMVKKIILGFFITSLIMIGVFGLVGCDDDPLKSYKDLGKTEIQTYADAKGQDNYSADDWAVICNTVATGKAAVDAAESTDEVDNAVVTTKAEINKVQQKELGMFYTLQEAYDEGLLTVEDLQQIANYHANGTSPTGELSTEITNKIKELAAKNMRESEITPVEDAKAADFSILRYYGVYNEIVALMINDPYHEYPAEDLDINETIAGVLFHYTNPNRIIVWKQ